MHNKKLYGTATVGTKGQVVIPAEARKDLQLSEGDRLYVVGSETGNYLGLIKEEELRSLLDKLTGNIETMTTAIGRTKRKK